MHMCADTWYACMYHGRRKRRRRGTGEEKWKRRGGMKVLDRRGPSISINTQATRFKEAPPGRSPNPKRRAIRASTRFNPVDRTRLLALVRSVALVGSIEPTNAAIYFPLLNSNPDLKSGLASRRCRCLLRLATAVFAAVIALARVPESLLQSL
ncbi:hypothetical protein B296_00040687 [Ensete ventricosum]|uniref:Uncharacterized protein n=1 Tax=Ensete ventricosum TaxID=4639 RepID=A0A426ZFG6_ENSVE|nr:hypothetical protein B296_00040687 [Ensete ventricosum]